MVGVLGEELLKAPPILPSRERVTWPYRDSHKSDPIPELNE